MAQSCTEGKYLDVLLRECMPCSMRCNVSGIPTRCSEYCVGWRCNEVSGQFYDRLLKKCLKCSELCGSHPPHCSGVCKSTNAVTVSQRPNGVSAVQSISTRGHPTARAELYSELLLYSLLGLCIVVLTCTLTAAILVLLKRAKGHQQEHQKPNKHGQSSEDSLMAREDDVSQEGSVNQDRPRATETCAYCFSDHTRAPHVLYQQAVPQQTPPACQDIRRHDNGLLYHPANANYDKRRSFRIICSPTQTSM